MSRSRNGSDRRRDVAFLLGAVLAACNGCAGAVGYGSPARTPLLAVRYEVHSRQTVDTGERLAELARDFREIRSVGFHAVWLDFATDDDRAPALEAGSSVGLRTILADSAIDRYARFGDLPPEFPSAQRLVLARAGPFFEPRGRAILALPPFSSGEVADRIIEIARICAALEPPGEVLIVGHADDADRFAHFETVWYAAWSGTGTSCRCETPWPRMMQIIGGDSTTPAAWSETVIRRAYFRGLAAGLTDGLLVWRYRSWPGECNGIAEADGRLPPAATAAMKSLLQHARQCASLAGAVCIEDDAASMESTRLHCASYRRESRRFVLVRNEDTEHFGRGVLRIPAALGGEPVARVVERETGTRYVRGDGPLTIPVQLAPAEATLFEVH
ncbi:MAG: hypothetical protein ACPMAQ_03615 [Phycisphaerae bacterium]